MASPQIDQAIPKLSKEICSRLLGDLEKGKRPILYATKCSLDNSIYSHKVGYLTPGNKKVATELNVSSVKKMSRAIFMLEILLGNLEMGAVNTKRELYYLCKGAIKHNAKLKPLDFQDQDESDDI
ncbi:MAG: DNA topoisomerase VI, partial [Bdellovibrionota bacterium]